MSADDSKVHPDGVDAEASRDEVADDVEANAQSTEEVSAAEDISSEEVSVDDLVSQLQASQDEIAKLKDAALRAEAEAQNIRRRTEKDIQSAHKYSQEKLIKDLLPVKDNLERALEASVGLEDGPARSVIDGVELTLKSFSDTLVKASVVELNPVGETFNPQHHQAMSMVESADAPANTVIAVVQKGYSLHDRLVRPAMVMVSKGAPTAQPSIDENA